MYKPKLNHPFSVNHNLRNLLGVKTTADTPKDYEPIENFNTHDWKDLDYYMPYNDSVDELIDRLLPLRGKGLFLYVNPNPHLNNYEDYDRNVYISPASREKLEEEHRKKYEIALQEFNKLKTIWLSNYKDNTNTVYEYYLHWRRVLRNRSSDPNSSFESIKEASEKLSVNFDESLYDKETVLQRLLKELVA